MAATAAAIATPALADDFKFPEADEYDGPGLFSGDDGVFSFSLNRKGQVEWEDSVPGGAKPRSGGSYMPPGSPSGKAGGSSGAQGGYQPPVSYQGGALSYPGQPAPAFQQPYRQPYPQAHQQPAYQPPAYRQPYQQPGYQPPAYQQQAQQPPAYGQPVYQPPAYQQPYRPPLYGQPYPQPPQTQGGANPGTGE